jgi:multidrug transporter EmrE-like cation transporter
MKVLIAVILASRFFLAEPISAIQWSGVALIVLGIIVIGWSQ